MVDAPDGAVEPLQMWVTDRTGVTLALHHDAAAVAGVSDDVSAPVAGAAAHLHSPEPAPTHQPRYVLLERRAAHRVRDRDVAFQFSAAHLLAACRTGGEDRGADGQQHK
jgi:hypothetical protein